MTEYRSKGKYNYAYRIRVTPDQHHRLERRYALTGQSKNSQVRQGLDLLFREERMKELELTEEDLNG